jgi:hypothetical protein
MRIVPGGGGGGVSLRGGKGVFCGQGQAVSRRSFHHAAPGRSTPSPDAVCGPHAHPNRHAPPPPKSTPPPTWRCQTWRASQTASGWTGP